MGDVPFADLANVDKYFGEVGAPPPAVAAPGTDSSSAGVARNASAPKAVNPPAPRSPKGPDAEAESHLMDHPYIGGFSPSAKDRALYDTILQSGSLPSTPALSRWF